MFAPQADIVRDKFHIMKYMNEAVDKVRKAEHKELLKQNDTRLKGTKSLWLKSRERFTSSNKSTFKELSKDQLSVGRAWNRKELLRHFWDYFYEKPARKYFKKSNFHSFLLWKFRHESTVMSEEPTI